MKLNYYKFEDEKKYVVRQATNKDTSKILNFIYKYWSKNHVFVKSRKLFYFQHKNKKKLNWIIATNKRTKKLEGILGFVSKNFYSKGIICKNDDIWIAMIMVAYPLKPSKGLGTYMVNCFTKKIKPNSISAIGINIVSAHLFKKVGMKIDYLNQYYLKKQKKFKSVNYKNIIITNNIDIIKKFKNYDQDFKNYNYFLNRYFKHPIYKYSLFILYENQKIKNFFIFRKIYFEKQLAIRIIDVGNIKLIHKFKKNYFLYLIKNFEANHIDLINFGIEESKFKKIGLKLRKNVFIPHHFEPYEKKNIDVMFSYISNKKKFYVFKGDSDLDRPSNI